MATDDQPKGTPKSKPKTLPTTILQRLKAHDKAVKDTPFSTDPKATQSKDE